MFAVILLLLQVGWHVTLILGIDPGSLKTGFGVIRHEGSKSYYVASGVIRLPNLSLPERLKVIFESICELIEEYQPEQFAIEHVFMAKSAASALKLGQARGAAIVAAVTHDLPVAEYEAKKVKQAVAGSGAADKAQVQQMVKTLLKLPAIPQEDAADALAIAICHANTHQHLVRVGAAKTFRRGRMV